MTTDEDGFWLDEYGTPWGHCNACGEEALATAECCEEGEVVPDDEPYNPLDAAHNGSRGDC